MQVAYSTKPGATGGPLLGSAPGKVVFGFQRPRQSLQPSGELVQSVEYKTLGLIPGKRSQDGRISVIDGNRYEVRAMFGATDVFHCRQAKGRSYFKMRTQLLPRNAGEMCHKSWQKCSPKVTLYGPPAFSANTAICSKATDGFNLISTHKLLGVQHSFSCVAASVSRYLYKTLIFGQAEKGKACRSSWMSGVRKSLAVLRSYTWMRGSGLPSSSLMRSQSQFTLSSSVCKMKAVIRSVFWTCDCSHSFVLYAPSGAWVLSTVPCQMCMPEAWHVSFKLNTNP